MRLTSEALLFVNLVTVKNLSTKQDTFEVEGTVIESLPNTMFRVEIDDNPSETQLPEEALLCTLSGKMRMYRIKVMPGDRVTCEVSKYDTSRGRITFRKK